MIEDHDEDPMFVEVAAPTSRIRARVRSVVDARKPRAPGDLVEALHTSTHPTSGRLLSVKPVRP